MKNKGLFLKTKDVKEKADRLLLNHPEIINNARSYFHNENGKTIIEEIVDRDNIITDELVNMYRLTRDDLKVIIDNVKNYMDPVIKEYDKKVAVEDALSKVIWNLKYFGKINSTTYNYLLSELLKIL